MTDTPNAPLDFDSAGAPASATCSACRQPIASTYYTIGSEVACERCKAGVELALQRRPGFSGYAKAIGLGSLWGLLGAAVWWGVRTFAHLEIGLIAIAIGYFVGTAVRRVAGGRGGPDVQLLAVALTYFWICANYVPDILQAVAESDDVSPLAALAAFPVAVFGLAMKAPFLEGASNAIGLLIIGFGLYQAWTLNRRVALAVAGPFSIAAGGAPSASG